MLVWGEQRLTSLHLLPPCAPTDWLELAGDVGCAEGNVVTALVAAKLLLPAKLQPSECWRMMARPGAASRPCLTYTHTHTHTYSVLHCTHTQRPAHTHCPAAVIPSMEGLAALDEQRQRVRAVKAAVNEIKADRTFLKASKAFTQQVGCLCCFCRHRRRLC